MRKVTGWLRALAVAGTVTTCATAFYVPSLHAEDLHSCSDSLGIQEPALSFQEMLMYKAKKLIDPKGADIEARGRTLSVIVDGIKKIGPNDPNKVDGLVACIKTSGNHRIEEASTDAIARTRTESAKRALYSLAANPQQNIAPYAARQLAKIDPDMAADVILGIARSGGRLGDDFGNILVGIGNEDSLAYFIGTKDPDYLSGFAIRNKDKEFLHRYSQEIIRIIVQEGMELPNGSLRCLDWRTMHSYGSAIRELDQTYAEGAIASDFEDRFRYACRGAWRSSDFDPGNMFLRGLRGK